MKACAPCVERHGEVIAIEGSIARIRLDPSPGCSGCRGCGSMDAATSMVSLAAPPGAVVGRHVTLSLPETSLVAAALFGYLLPVVCLLLGAVGAVICWPDGVHGPGDASAVGGAGLGFAVGVLLVRLAHRHVSGANALVRPSVSLFSTPGEHS